MKSIEKDIIKISKIKNLIMTVIFLFCNNIHA